MTQTTCLRPALLAMLLALGGCAPFAVNWYHDPGIDAAQPRDDVQLVVLNRSDRACTVRRLWLNPQPDGSAFRWQPPQPSTLLPGQVLVLRLAQFSWTGDEAAGRDAGCTLPLRVDIEAGPCGWSIGDAWRVDLVRRLPNALPESWSRCQPAQASAPLRP